MEDNIKKSCKLVLGNGFDLYCGLKTRYQQFFDAQKKEYNEIKVWEAKVNEIMYRLNDGESAYIPTVELNENISFWDLLFYYDPRNEKRINWCDVEELILDFFEKTDSYKDTLFDNLYDAVNDEEINSRNEWIKYPTIYLISKKTNTKTKIDFATYLLDELNKFEKKFGNYVYLEFTSNENIFSSKYSKFINLIKKIGQ